MVHQHRRTDDALSPAYADRLVDAPIPKDRLPDGEASPEAAYAAFHVSDELRRGGWQVPAYTMPAGATDVAVPRVVVREGFSLDLADTQLGALGQAVARLEAHPPMAPRPAGGFSHT